MEHEILYFRIGDIVFKLDSDLLLWIPKGNSENFRVNESKPDMTYTLRMADDLNKEFGKLKYCRDALLCHEMMNEKGELVRGYQVTGKGYDAMLRLDSVSGDIVYIHNNFMADRFAFGFDIVNFFALEYVFFRFGGFFLHSSHINVNGKALIFSAPSGTGKSTQAALWEQYAGAEVINGDRTLLRKKDGVWHAYGCPMCGTSGIHKQGNEPIHAIMMLEQGKDNRVRRLTAGEAFSRMYPEITVPRWNRELVLRAMELLDDVMANVPIYSFSCTKDESAVHALREALDL